jgi:hypothetical protein
MRFPSFWKNKPRVDTSKPDKPAKPPVRPPMLPLLTPEQAEKIVAALTERQATQNCPRCTNDKFSLAPGIIYLPLQRLGVGGILIGGPSIPCVAATCSRCGYVAQHALGALGFLGANGEITGL